MQQFLVALAVGLGISAVAFLPLVVWQYQRYGRFSPSRTFWSALSFTYASGLIAYTLFPLPQECTRSGHIVVLDPTEYFRDMAHHFAGMSPAQMATSWDVLQMVFNVALFVPLGVILRDFLELRPGRAILTGFLVSLLVETTQYTGNFGLFCQYRVADVNDLITNTLGTAVGVAIAALIPNFVASPAQLRATRTTARPVHRARRAGSMLLDYLTMVIAAELAFILVVVVRWALDPATPIAEQQPGWEWLPGVAALLVVYVPALVGSGASIGQRIVWLRPSPAPRWRLLLRASIAGLWALGTLGVPVASGLFSLLAFASLVSLIWTLRGISGVIAGVDIIDSRPAAAPR
ncbi:hypothetical protein C1Y63_04120 [Corynebacterium sp. 13CS0277]|uniref:VanZ family protein n=1 Tax=Corynebacterium sp. 13CS0277 TaxID=2071994 RepID=UPI000D042AC1|nr:VanZ family protein [Corynebacterium sp. 13CS0277]PRQ11835.1 hypothetical protein C1Y63_04120 [Corynebacterium sp. 13CS0277]